MGRGHGHHSHARSHHTTHHAHHPAHHTTHHHTTHHYHHSSSSSGGVVVTSGQSAPLCPCVSPKCGRIWGFFGLFLFIGVIVAFIVLLINVSNFYIGIVCSTFPIAIFGTLIFMVLCCVHSCSSETSADGSPTTPTELEAQAASETPYGTPAELTPAGDQEQPIPGQVPPTAAPYPYPAGTVDPSYPYPPAQPVDPSYPPTVDPSYPPTAPTDAPYPSPYPSETAPGPY